MHYYLPRFSASQAAELFFIIFGEPENINTNGTSLLVLRIYLYMYCDHISSGNDEIKLVSPTSFILLHEKAVFKISDL